MFPKQCVDLLPVSDNSKTNLQNAGHNILSAQRNSSKAAQLFLRVALYTVQEPETFNTVKREFVISFSRKAIFCLVMEKFLFRFFTRRGIFFLLFQFKSDISRKRLWKVLLQLEPSASMKERNSMRSLWQWFKRDLNCTFLGCYWKLWLANVFYVTKRNKTLRLPVELDSCIRL